MILTGKDSCRISWQEPGVLQLVSPRSAPLVISSVLESISCYALVLNGKVNPQVSLSISCPVLATPGYQEEVNDALAADWCVWTRLAADTRRSSAPSCLASDVRDAQGQMAAYISTLRRIKVVGMRNSLASMRPT